MQILLQVSRAIDATNTFVGRMVYWLVLVTVLISAGNAVIRYGLNMSSNAWLEVQWYLFSAIFLLCAGYTLLNNEHIRIDIVNSHLPKRTRDWIDICGHVFFLLPLCAVMLIEGWPYFWLALKSGEMSGNAGGLIRWPVKGLIVLGFVLLLLQGLSELIKRIAILRGLIPDPHAAKSGPH
ncbi:MAG: TRAP transporter small permease subunit [Alphaproteobacteria bacterium]|nr:TRAP transporter small permease subunit [Alphaproteobacteria bacterium]